ncbi:segregation and condensation protein A [Kitasatospora camelliae]|uniref:Segregation and condensation protein A n=1 Tax=Kitasatospora camelliae TaxID=3156397 RepID=A0AAU8K000_9ACTN
MGSTIEPITPPGQTSGATVPEQVTSGVEGAGAAGPAGAGAAGAGAVDARPVRAVAVRAGGSGAGGPAEGEERGGFRVRLDNFEGPFDLLLGLIAKRRLDVTEVALSKVTDEFVAHIRAMGPDWDLDAATEFLVVAATLLDLKAARLLPAAEVEDEEDLAVLEARDLLFARLLQYRAYKQVAAVLADRWAAEQLSRPRTVGLEPHHAQLLPDVVLTVGPERFAQLAARAMAPKPKPVVYVDHIHTPPVSVREQAAVVVDRLTALGEASFARLVADAENTLVVVARFLALLELYRERVLDFEQPDALGELVVRWTAETDRVVEVTDEFDRPPGEGGEGGEASDGAGAGSGAGGGTGALAVSGGEGRAIGEGER